MGEHDKHRQRMRQRFLKVGLDGFADHEVLELLLFYALPRQDTNPIAHALMDRYGSLDGVLRASVLDLQQVKGIGESAAVLLRLVPLLVQRAKIGEAEREWVLNSTENAGRYLMERFSQDRSEAIYELCLDRKGKLLSCLRIGEGGGTAVSLDIRKVVENALIHEASAVILAHNHPSGVALPSREDYTATVQVREALQSLGISLLDHIIVSDGDYVSLRDSAQNPLVACLEED